MESLGQINWKIQVGRRLPLKRGIANSDTQRTLKDFCSHHRPNFVCITEPLCVFDSISPTFCRSMGLHFIGVNAKGTPSMWIFGSIAFQDATIVLSHSQYVTVSANLCGIVHQISFIYANVNHITCRSLWSSLMDVVGSNDSWLVLGDFNSVLDAHETTGNISTISCDDFWVALTIACVTLPRSHSNHHPLLVSCSVGVSSGPQPFRFQGMWISHPSFLNLVGLVWLSTISRSGTGVVIQKLKMLKKALRRIGFEGFSDDLFHLNTAALADLDSVLKQHEIFLKEKSRVRPKDSGGLGVKDLGILNKTMLKKFIWRMLTEESFVFTYLRAHFFTQDHRPRTWWLVGHHSKVRFWTDNWLGDPLIDPVENRSSLQPPLDSVVGDIYSNAMGWDIPTSFHASHPDVTSKIEKVVASFIPPSRSVLIWHLFHEEDLRHLFLNCPFVHGLWDVVSSTFGHKLKLDDTCLDLWQEAIKVVFSTQLKAL
ncbi:hypothetical protein Q3G72_017180 [Acer saccharum]|nr:hypothetical protein Q3G72_017180 [Acer saccharum]